MTDRRVTHCGKDRDGNITSLCNPTESWSPLRKLDAIQDIRTRTHHYYVQGRAQRTFIHVFRGDHLRIDFDAGSNLHNLPAC